MNARQIDRLLETVGGSIEPRARKRLDGYADAARRCDERIAELRSRFDTAIMDADGDAVLDTMVELEALERVQLRVDAGFRASVGALADPGGPTPVGEGPPH